MRCIRCNSEVADGMRFCPNCGNLMTFHQQPYYGQYQQPQFGQYQQPRFGQYQQSQFGQYLQPQQGQYQRYKQKRPCNPRLSFVQAISLASGRITDSEGRSRRSEFWWWSLAAVIITNIVGFIIGFITGLLDGIGVIVSEIIDFVLQCFLFILQYMLLFSIIIRRLNDVPAPRWIGKVFLFCYGVFIFLTIIYYGAFINNVDLFRDLVLYVIGEYFFYNIYIISCFVMLVPGLMGLYYFLQDSNQETDPKHGPSPKYTLK